MNARAFHKANKKFYPVVKLATHGTIRTHELLDIYSPDADDGEAPIFRAADFEVVIQIGSGLEDAQSQELFDGDITKTSEGVIEHIVWNKRGGGFYIRQNKMMIEEPLTIDIAETITIVGNVKESRESQGG